MANIYNSSKTVIQNLIKESTNHNSFVPILLVLVTIPLSYALNNIALGIFLFVALVTFKKANFIFKSELLFPILLYLLMVISYFWSIESKSTLKALAKEITLILIPLGFLLFDKILPEQKRKIINGYSYFMAVFVGYYLIRAIIRYFVLNDARVFFYHGENDKDYGLVPKLLNAIHVSVFVALAFFNFYTKTIKTKLEVFISLVLFGFILLLSSKNIIVVLIILVLIHDFFVSKKIAKTGIRNLILLGILIVVIFSTGRIKDRFKAEFQSDSNKEISITASEGIPKGVHIVSVKEAWTNKQFSPNDYFSGTAFRVYQFRIFTELLHENSVFFTGFGLNATDSKIEQKAIYYNLYLGNINDSDSGYQNKNFHNQYVQNFADLGIFGLLLLLIMLFVNLKNSLISKDFVHFAFAILMISLFLTESFLCRQRGVVFFTLLYCLFNSGISQKNFKNSITL